MTKIIEVNIKYNSKNEIEDVLVLVQFSKGDIRVLGASTKQVNGYFTINSSINYVISQLIDNVVDYGMEITNKDVIPKSWLIYLPYL